MKRYIIRRRRPSRIWHRWLGFIVVVPLLLVSFTGILLNHIHGLGWDKRHVESDWILARYGMKLEGEPVTYQAANRQVSDWGGQLYWDGMALAAEGALQGAVELPDGVAVVCERVVYVFDQNGELIEQLDEVSLPEGPFVRAGSWSKGSLVVASRGGKTWAFGEELLEFSPLETGDVQWAEPVEADASLRERMKKSYRGEGLPWSRVLLDIHSGRFFGAIGKWIVDLTVILVVLLSLTGLVLGVRALRTAPKEGAKYD